MGGGDPAYVPRRKSCRVGKSFGLRVLTCFVRAMILSRSESLQQDTGKSSEEASVLMLVQIEMRWRARRDLFKKLSTGANTLPS